MRTLALALALALALVWPQWVSAAKGSASPCRAGSGVRPYVVEVYSISSLPRSHDALAPLVRELSVRSGLCLSLQAFDTVSAFHERFTAGQPDFAITNPYLLATTHARIPYQPLLMDAHARLQGVLVVRRDSRYQTLEDLRGVELAVPASNTFVASLLIRDLLHRAGIPYRLVDAGTHANVLRAVALGRVAAGGAVQNALEHESPELVGALRVLLRTDQQPPPPLVANPRVPAADREALVQAVLALAREPRWREALTLAWLADPVRADYRRDYMPLERLKLDTGLAPGRP